MKGQKIKAPHEEASPGGAKVIDLMAALRKSIGEGSGGKAKSTSRRTPTARRTTKKRA
jgi:DNA end-binding protein Ku